MKNVEKLLKHLESDFCDYDMCRRIIAEIGGYTQIINDENGLKTTPLHEVISYGHYDFALELINEPCVNLYVEPNGSGPIMWDLQYLDSETEEEQWKESENKLRLIRALINSGANPNPIGDSQESLLSWIRHKIGENEGTAPKRNHYWQMEHIIDAHTYGDMNSFLNKLNEKKIDHIMLSKWGFWLIDDNLCNCDHAIVIFEDGDMMLLSSNMIGDDEWNFYATSLNDNFQYESANYNKIVANTDTMKFLSLYSDEECPNLHWLDVVIDDAVLRIRADDPNITVGIVGIDENDHSNRKRKKLFETDN